ncbi:MAG: 4'-phosphopantetheinyl transferase superfamily protein [Clostridia bacterium]|nr:4'-phosphopantetheinyl transferase superfamily protein [Clostridia bacterium]
METDICRIYCAEVTPLSDPECFADALSQMPAYRKRKVLSLRHVESQRLSLGVGLLLVLALESRGVEARTAAFAEGAYGKPYLPAYPEIQFSLSHSGIWAMCAVCDEPVGCDVERAERGSERLARRFFHPAEQAALAAAGEETARDNLFTRLWTRKESYIKARGEGLSLPLDSFSALADGPDVHYAEAELMPGYRFSCCVLGKARAVQWHQIPLGTLLLSRRGKG